MELKIQTQAVWLTAVTPYPLKWFGGQGTPGRTDTHTHTHTHTVEPHTHTHTHTQLSLEQKSDQTFSLPPAAGMDS